MSGRIQDMLAIVKHQQGRCNTGNLYVLRAVDKRIRFGILCLPNVGNHGTRGQVAECSDSDAERLVSTDVAWGV